MAKSDNFSAWRKKRQACPEYPCPKMQAGNLTFRVGLRGRSVQPPPLAGGGMDGQGFDPLRVLDSSPYLGGGVRLGQTWGWGWARMGWVDATIATVHSVESRPAGNAAL